MRTACALLAALALSACGSAQSPARARLARYIRAVDHVEAQMRAPLSTISEIARQASGTAGPRSRVRLAGSLDAAAGSLAGLRARLAALRAPASAATLRSLVLELADRQISLTRELSQIIVYPAAFAAAVRPLGRATRTLAHALAQTSGPSVAAVYAARVRALGVFAAVVRSVSSRLRALSVPAVYAPGYRGERRALAMMRSAAGRLASALSNGGAGAGAALRALDAAFALGFSPSLHRAEVAAVRAYDRQVQSLSSLAARIEGERQRLSATVG